MFFTIAPMARVLFPNYLPLIWRNFMRAFESIARENASLNGQIPCLSLRESKEAQSFAGLSLFGDYF
jgi:hypothetical protein